MNWLVNNIVGLVGIIISIFIAYHIFYLSKKISFTNKIKHAQKIRETVERLLGDNSLVNRVSQKVEIINVKKYFKCYPFTNKKDKHGYTYLGAELKQFRFDGIEFFCEIKEVYINSDKEYSLTKKNGYSKCENNVLKAGIIPYDWIKHIYVDGDMSTGYDPQFFVNFIGKNKEPYKYFNYYLGGANDKVNNFREINIT